MRERVEIFVVLSFSLGCASHSRVELGAPKADTNGHVVPGLMSLTPPHTYMHAPTTILHKEEKEEERSLTVKMKQKPFSGFLLPSKPNITAGMQRLIRGIRTLSPSFFYKEDIEKKEPEMDIGHPTYLKYITHTGLDGSTTTNNVKGWHNQNLKAPELLSFSSISLQQFELAMPSQAHQPLITRPSLNFC